ncbi:MAG TPA: hydroxymethylglutaryl-CoA reductase [Acidobacteriota bacterium]|nr:hydroxymethylglutaryl-CoA reductase [Acidobacteriota bacterium]
MNGKGRSDGSKRGLVPRYRKGGYSRESVDQRRKWLQEKTAASLEHVGRFSFDPRQLRGNLENPIGAAQVPLGVAGPLQVRGEHAQGTFYVPLATSEGALVRSFERGSVALTRAGGVEARVVADANLVSPSFFFDSVEAAASLGGWVEEHFQDIRRQAESTTSHGRLLDIRCRVFGRQVIAAFRYHTGDAQGMNMIVRATDKACRWMSSRCGCTGFHIFSGQCSEKRASGFLLAEGKGKWATASATLPEKIIQTYLGTSSQGLYDVWHATVLGHLSAHAVGYSGHLANGLCALFIATGQDVANVANACAGITDFRLCDEGLLVSVTLPALEIATVGGGTDLPTQRECLQLLGCHGSGHSKRLAEIAAATALAGEISMGAAIASGEFAAAHDHYGRNRPDPE